MINGCNLVAGSYQPANREYFKATDPSTGALLEGDFYIADTQTVELAMDAATAAFNTYKNISSHQKAQFLRVIADEISALGDSLVSRAATESGLPAARLLGEMGRTTGQLRMFASLIEEGSWVDAVIDTAQPERTPLPKPDIRRMLTAVGPVVVFGASNFPLAFSVAGGDTASALAAGCTVVVKAHPAHPGTSAIVGAAIIKAAQQTGMPDGVFSLLFDNGYQVGQQLVKHQKTKAVAFTGSFKGGMALLQLAQQRQTPIPVFTEMGSVNPVVLLPEIINRQAAQLANKLAASITLGAGQFCTNPGLLLAIDSPELNTFINTLTEAITKSPSATMLTPGIWENYQTLSTTIMAEKGISVLSRSVVIDPVKANQSVPAVATVRAVDFLANPKFKEEIFGPWSLLVIADDAQQLEKVAASLEGQLTVTLMAEKDELNNYAGLINQLTDKSGRIILNGVPTGVEVCAAMQHGGPFPASSDSRYTSVGTGAIYRFVRPLAWQDWENALLPPALQDSNPLQIWRQIDNQRTKEVL